MAVPALTDGAFVTHFTSQSGSPESLRALSSAAMAPVAPYVERFGDSGFGLFWPAVNEWHTVHTLFATSPPLRIAGAAGTCSATGNGGVGRPGTRTASGPS